MGRPKRYRQKRHEQAHSLKSKSLFGHLVTELMITQNFSQREAEIVAKPCFTYFKDNLCDTAEGQIKFDIIKGINNHKRTKKQKKKAILTPIAYSDIELFQEFGLKELQLNRVLRMIEEAYRQEGLLDMKSACFLGNITDRALRERMHSLWKKGIRAPLSMMSKKYRENMSTFRQSYCVEHYLLDEDHEELRKELCISQTDWEQIYSTFRHIGKNRAKDPKKLASAFNIPEVLVNEYIGLANKYCDSHIFKEYNNPASEIECPGDISTREKFIHELKQRCGFSPALADKLERDLRELSKKISLKKRNANEIIYYAVSDHEPAGKPLSECELIPVKIEYIAPDDREFFTVDSTNELKWFRTLRYCTQVRFQGALLNQIDLAFLLGISPAVLQKLSKEHEKVVLPTRGNMCDIGPAPSHAEKIIGLYIQGFTETQIKRRTAHDLSSIERYIDAFTKVVGLLVVEGLETAEIRKILGCSRRLVNKYIELFHKYNTAEYQWWMSKIRKKYEGTIKKKLKWR